MVSSLRLLSGKPVGETASKPILVSSLGGLSLQTFFDHHDRTTPTQFYLPHIVSPMAVETDLFSVDGKTLYAVPQIDKLYTRQHGSTQAIRMNSLEYDWFITLFKYGIFPQIYGCDKFYSESSTQYRLLYAFKTMFDDPTSLNLTSLFYQASNHATPASSHKNGSVMFSHQQFAEWMSRTVDKNIPLLTLMNLTKVMLGRNM